LKTLKGHKREVNIVAIGINGEIISGSHDSTIKIWDGKDFRLIKTLDKDCGGHAD
jgi:WD40 repeat protein